MGGKGNCRRQVLTGAGGYLSTINKPVVTGGPVPGKLASSARSSRSLYTSMESPRARCAMVMVRSMIGREEPPCTDGGRHTVNVNVNVNVYSLGLSDATEEQQVYGTCLCYKVCVQVQGR